MAPPAPGALITALMSVATPNSGGTRLGEPEGLRQALAGRYRLDRAIGRGGMATVWLAHDLRHDRPVALKVLHPGLAPTLGLERFQREIRLAARLQHPHILTVLDSGAGPDGLLWFTMPYVQGESLRQRMDRERRLPVEDAVAIAREAAEALAFAHAEGVVHRDVKPENILLGAGHALVADFGIALAVRGGESLTDPGLAVGTPAYMSPEQAAGDRELDGRTDVYALGTLLYEMLAGQLPYPGPANRAVVAARRAGQIPSLDALRPDVPVTVQRAVEVALAPDPEQRFATADEFARALGGGTVSRGGIVPPYRRTAIPPTSRSPSARPRSSLASSPSSRSARATRARLGPARHPPSRRAPVPEPRPAGGRVLRRRNHRRDPGQAGRASRSAGHRLRQLGAVQADRQEPAGDRARAGGGLPPHREGALGEGRGRQPRAGEPGADPGRDGIYPVAAAVRRVAHRCLPGAGRGRIAGGGGAGRGARVERAGLAGRHADRQPHRVRPLPAGERGGRRDRPGVAARAAARGGFYQRAVELDSSFAPAWAQLSRIHSYLYYISVPTAQGDSEARAAADRALSLAPGARRGAPGPGRLLPLGPARRHRRARRLHPGQPARPQQRRAAQGARPGRAEPGQLGAEPAGVHPGVRPGPALGLGRPPAHLQPDPDAPSPRGARLGRPRAGARLDRRPTCGSPRRWCSWARGSCPRRARCWRRAMRHADPGGAGGVRRDLLRPLLGAERRAAAAPGRPLARAVRRRPADLGPRDRRHLAPPGRHRPRPRLRRLGPHRGRGAHPRGAARRPAPRPAGHRARDPGPEGRGDPGRPTGDRAARPRAWTRTLRTTCSISWRGPTSWRASRSGRST